MTPALSSLIAAIAVASDEAELRQRFVEEAGEYFAARRRRLFFFDEPVRIAGIELPSVPPEFLSNPVLRYVREHHAPVHEGMVAPDGLWERLCARFDHGHVLVGPIVGDGRFLGTANFTRARNAPAFAERDLLDLGALCLHFSVRLMALRLQAGRTASESTALTVREHQIAELVARGFTNAEIGKQLWITENSVKQALKRMYRKLGIASRAQLVTALHSGPVK